MRSEPCPICSEHEAAEQAREQRLRAERAGCAARPLHSTRAAAPLSSLPLLRADTT